MDEYGTQLDLFDLMYDYHKFDKGRPVRLIETFAGIGTQKMAFDRLGIDVDVVAIVEVDKFAMLSYASIHTDYLELRPTYFDTHTHTQEEMVEYLQDRNIGINFTNMKQSITIRNNIEIVRDYYLACILTNNLGDISKVKGSDLPKGIDVLTYSFPCTDLSKAGKQKGLNDTRSGLVYQVFRIVDELKELNNKPTILIMENVVDLIQSKFINEFNEMQLELEDKEYINYNFVMNAKDFGVAQNRNRVFMVSLPLESNYKEPNPFKLEKRLKDYLEYSVDESYFLNDKQNMYVFGNAINKELKDHYDREKAVLSPLISQTITTKMDRRVGDTTYLVEGYDEAIVGDSISLDQPKSKTRRGRVGKQHANTLTTSCNQGVVLGQYDHGSSDDFMKGKSRFIEGDVSRAIITKPNVGIVEELNKELRIRKLTPLECWRLMGIDDEYFYKARQVNSNAQLYKQAGNAIVVDVFANILKSMI